MTSDEFESQFSRLTAHFHLPTDDSRDVIALDWLKALQHYHVDALDLAVTELTRTSEDRYWPALGKIVGLIKTRIDKYERAHGQCRTCEGSTWVDAGLMKTRDNRVYDFVRRCPDCGVPEPKGGSTSHLTPLSEMERQIYMAGEWPMFPMPSDGRRKKGPRVAHNPTELRAWCAAMADRLFGESKS